MEGDRPGNSSAPCAGLYRLSEGFQPFMLQPNASNYVCAGVVIIRRALSFHNEDEPIDRQRFQELHRITYRS